MALRFQSRPGKKRRALIGLALTSVAATALYYQVLFDRYWYTPPGGPSVVHTTPGAATLRLPSLGKTAPLIYTISNDPKQIGEDLEKGVSLAPSNARPGQAGNVFITGHSLNWPWSGPYRAIFGNLDELKAGDEVVIEAERRYVYRVSGQRVVTADEVSVMENDTSKHQLTLMTCWPPGTTWKRRVVTADLVP